MNTAASRPRTPIHLWFVGVLSLLWNAVGAFDYLATKLQLESYMGAFTPEQLDYFYGFPVWVTVFWALAVWSAVAGSIGLLLRKRWTVCAFRIALASLVMTTIYNFGLSNGAEIMGSTGVISSVIIWIISLLLLWYDRAMGRKGVLT